MISCKVLTKCIFRCIKHHIRVLENSLFFRLNFFALVTVISHPSNDFFFNLFVVLGSCISPQFTYKVNRVCVFILVRKFIASIGQIQELSKSGPALFYTKELSLQLSFTSHKLFISITAQQGGLPVVHKCSIFWCMNLYIGLKHSISSIHQPVPWLLLVPLDAVVVKWLDT